jgi:hypothetical protein
VLANPVNPQTWPFTYGIDHLVEDVRWIVKAFGRPDAKAGIPK